MKRRDSPALLAARNKNWSKFTVMGAIANLSKLSDQPDSVATRIKIAIGHLREAVKEMS